MKKYILIALIISGFTSLMTSCKNHDDDSRNILLLTDSTTFQNTASGDTADVTARSNTENTATPPYTGNEVNDQTANNNTSSDDNSDQTQEDKKGWSKGAQGAVIGGAAGAVGGAIIADENKAAGAAIGAAVGAVGGYIIGNELEKKEDKNNKEDEKVDDEK